MKKIIVRSQEKLDRVPNNFDGRIVVEFGTNTSLAVLNHPYKYPVEARKNSFVEVHGNIPVVAWDNSTIVAWGKGSVEALDNSFVEAWGTSRVVAWDNSSVVAHEDNYIVAYGESFITAHGNSSVIAWNSSSVVAMGNSSVWAHADSFVEASGNSQVVDLSQSHRVEVSGNARIVSDPITPKEYAKINDCKLENGYMRLYKAVHKRDGGYWSHWDPNFKYIIGGEIEADALDTDPMKDCGEGIHAADKSWCVDFGRNWDDLAILEVEMPVDTMVVPINGSGKVRADRARVIREVPLEECGLLGRHLARRKSNV